MNVGQKIRVTRNANSWLNQATWWPEGDITGTVTKVCKNGAIYVAQDQFRNISADGRRTRVFSTEDDVTIVII
jgi:hypothetical protein